MRFIIRILGNCLAIYLAAYLVPGVSFKGDWKILLLAGFILSLINLIIKPILKMISFPLILLTFGLFSLIINIFLVWLLMKFIPELNIIGWWALFWTAIFISLVNWLVSWFIKKRPKES